MLCDFFHHLILLKTTVVKMTSKYVYVIYDYSVIFKLIGGVRKTLSDRKRFRQPFEI